LESFVEERGRIARFYDGALASAPDIAPLAIPEGCRSSYYKYIALLEEGVDRTVLKKRLREEWDVGLSGEVYELPCHKQPIFEGMGGDGAFPVAEDICRRHVCLPLYQGMSEEEMGRVVSGITEVLSTM
ncbi:MAG: DegT/DnrJ/EryC1/StrS family aminotransferase, partial [bacterium]